MLLLKLTSFFTRKRIVILQDMDGDHYYTLENESPFGGKCANVYWWSKIGHVWLLPDGTCQGSSSYIKNWMYKK